MIIDPQYGAATDSECQPKMESEPLAAKGIMEFMSSSPKKVMVTGSGGLIGSECVRKLVSEPVAEILV